MHIVIPLAPHWRKYFGAIILIAACGLGMIQDAKRIDSAREYSPRAEAKLTEMLCRIDGRPGKEVLGTLGDHFPVEQSAADNLSKRIDELFSSAGAALSVEIVERRGVVPSNRLAKLSAVSYHKNGPVLWEATVYDLSDPWMFLKVRFTAENVVDELERIAGACGCQSVHTSAIQLCAPSHNGD